MGEIATCGPEVRQEKTTMIRFEAMAQDRVAFLYELYHTQCRRRTPGSPL
jgi:hypothetical protein